MSAAIEKTVFITGPDPKLELAYSDVWLPGLYSRRVLVFELPATSSHEKAVAVLERALKALVEGTPELGGESVLVPAEQHDGALPWRAIKPYKGVELRVKDLSSTVPSYAELARRGFPLAEFKDRLLMPIPAGIEPEPQPVAKLQVSLISGGILLSTCFYHHLSDGNGMNAITRALADACKRAASDDAALAPVVLDTSRAIMNALDGSMTDLAQHHPAYLMIPNVYRPGAPHPPADAAPAAPSAEEGPNAPPASGAPLAPPAEGFIAGFFRLSDSGAAQLKADASAHTTVSTHDAISAVLWLTLLRARIALGRLPQPADDDEDTRSVFSFPHNARRHVGLAPEWVGNCVYFCLAEARRSELARENADALPLLAARIRAALSRVDRELVASNMAVRRPDPYSLAWWAVGDMGDVRNVSITSFYHSGLLGVDWGAAWGRVRHFTTTDSGAMGAGFERASYVGPKLEGSRRGCDVSVGADPEELQFVLADELWNRYFEPLRTERLGA